ncbi:MAG: CpaF family protein [Gemmatimonadota bacterium]|nr:CpaF family protein [Gemmatimonadota bacterium]MDQ8169062.1 CpaF family protein [Gemmatimonadota bacterium]MDQ8173900.1 CpaF family protein [Gemmatimonadota bacterium]
MPTLRERLLGVMTPPQSMPAVSDGDGAPLRGTPTPTAPSGLPRSGSAVPARRRAPGAVGAERRTRTFTPRRIEVETLGPVEQLKVDLHRRLVERLDLEALEQVSDGAVLTAQIRNAVADFLRTEGTPLTQGEREDVIEQIVYEVTGLGPIEPFFRDPTISDILVNGPRDIYIERRGRLSRVPVAFRNDAHLMAIIDRIVSRVGRRVDESSPMVDARLPDGSRVNAIIPPLALDGPILSIRRFGAELPMQALVENGTLTQDMVELLSACVQARLNIMISGGTGSGKTTLLNALSVYIPATERVVTIEDAAELRLQQEHVCRLETRPPNAEGRGQVVARDLVRNALRMRPDRIIVGEVRGAEALDMLQAMNTGHEGSLTTIHANSPRDALARVETMIQFASTSLPLRAIREQIASALEVVVQIARMADGTRRVTAIAEITSMEGDIISMQDIYKYHRRGITENGEVVGDFEATGVRPLFMERLQVAGIELPNSLFAQA